MAKNFTGNWTLQDSLSSIKITAIDRERLPKEIQAKLKLIEKAFK